MNAVKERPILFSAPMVRAILEGRKTVTRRAVNLQLSSSHKWRGWVVDSTASENIGKASWGIGEGPVQSNAAYARCPYGRPGDRLWVREAWAADVQLDSIAPRELSQGEPIWYPADGATRQTGCAMISQGRGRPSIHMPRWASRILLEITDVRVERLQAITDEQAMAEGVRLYTEHAELGDWYHVDGIETYSADPRKSFELLWTSINGAESWNANPWVWVVEFKRIDA